MVDEAYDFGEVNADWTEVKITVDVKNAELAGDIANMVVPYGIYIEDYSDLKRVHGRSLISI